ncbi:class E sortase [Streptomyces sp. SID2888]|uniref:class E sortase n=1 Tax=Streptomyces sp. SID2888 TaxID=2690256 RepID=UPI001370F810|nr:class E sortase [Streptomyces sp. SID2888]
MTALRPERDTGAAYGDAADPGSSYGRQPCEGSGAWQEGQEWSGHGGYPGESGAGYGEQSSAPPQLPQQGQGLDATAVLPSYGGTTSGASYGDPAAAPSYAGPPPVSPVEPARAAGARPPAGSVDDATVALRALDDKTVALRAVDVEEVRRAGDRAGESAPVPGGRAARRKAAKRTGRRGSGPQTAEKPSETAAEAPRSRMEARRAARAQKPGAAVLVSRVVGELFMTTGVLMLLFVSYQLWWSNVRAHQEAGSAAKHLQQDWASGKRAPGEFAPGQGFALLHIPKLDVVVPIAEGISKTNVLDKGMVGHYGEESLKTAMPDDRTGNFGLAGHRNTHGEPFRYINRLQPGDAIVVETQDKYFVYKMASTLPVTPPSNTSVLDPIPRDGGFTQPGRYITLTTCTPEFTSKYRLIVWGKMVEERPRSKGKPDALIS